MAHRIRRFIKSNRLDVHRFADVGCGPAITLFELARKMPDCRFDGYDVSTKVLNQNRKRARKEGLQNLRFIHSELPGLQRESVYDIVICIATIHYVRDVRRALRELYGMVSPGGYLIFNYPNRVQQAATRREARQDPVTKRRFALVLSGVNLLTRDRIAAILKQRPRSCWREVGEPPRRLNPCVIVRKR